MKFPYESAINSITGLISEWIPDPDKAREIILELEKLKVTVKSDLLQAKTTPFVDGAVKILIAINDLVLPWFRPIGSFLMTAVGVYFHYKQIPMDGAIHAVLDGSFPAWMASRHVNKQTETKAKARVMQSRQRESQPDYSDWDDEP